ncbi:MAG TPA: hypothetical protein VFX51_15260 [Solirubrobacteraceae bacterium]|nr:hypothetical protein [Solirubrobacteraceae bacterium]
MVDREPVGDVVVARAGSSGVELTYEMVFNIASLFAWGLGTGFTWREFAILQRWLYKDGADPVEQQIADAWNGTAQCVIRLFARGDGEQALAARDRIAEEVRAHEFGHGDGAKGGCPIVLAWAAQIDSLNRTRVASGTVPLTAQAASAYAEAAIVTACWQLTGRIERPSEQLVTAACRLLIGSWEAWSDPGDVPAVPLRWQHALWSRPGAAQWAQWVAQFEREPIGPALAAAMLPEYRQIWMEVQAARAAASADGADFQPQTVPGWPSRQPIWHDGSIESSAPSLSDPPEHWHAYHQQLMHPETARYPAEPYA